MTVIQLGAQITMKLTISVLSQVTQRPLVYKVFANVFTSRDRWTSEDTFLNKLS
ncbi:hypothetical protein WN51_08995 [Melipona quadrifasciata]|uniref:Uncharacterized protein n=1 Tax=Melipona quadrifasciata TaxID=166423 RepID=A0A0N0BK91_9HYME|nr:hypothetical protein WN51_08995 [Melipona quadrifasciata]